MHLRQRVPPKDPDFISSEQESEKATISFEFKKKLGGLAALFFVGLFFYYQSLEGQPEWQTKEQREDWIHERIFALSFYLIGSVICFSVTFVTVLFSQAFPPPIKFGIFVVMVFLQIFVFSFDTGVSAWHHGWFNIGAFCVFVAPVVIVSLVIYFLKALLPQKLFFRGLGAVVFLVALTLLFRHFWTTNLWIKGLWGQQMEMDPVCSFTLPTVNWMEVPPKGALNFWTGSQHCSTTKRLARFTETGALEITGCKVGKHAVIDVYPLTEISKLAIPFADRTDQDVFQRQLLLQVNSTEWKVSGDGLVPFSVVPPTAETVMVHCQGQDNTLIRNVKKSEAQLGSTVRLSEKKEGSLNILIIYLDALSRRHFIRRFPKTVSWLHAHQGNEFEGFQFFRYSAVGTNTRPNTRRMFTSPNTTDCHPFWDILKNKGYVTGLIDDSCTDWAAKYANQSSEPHHHFIAPFCSQELRPLNNAEGTFKGPFAITKRCLHGRHAHSYLFDYARQFWFENYADRLKFGIVSFNEGHEATGEVITQVDDDLSEFLKDGLEGGAFEDTVIFLASDHGLHMGPSYQLHFYSSVLEARLPLMVTLWPKSFLANHPKIADNLKKNQQRMFTGGEFLNTMLALGDMTKATPYQFEGVRPFEYSPHYEFPSLFDEIPMRDCVQANIPNLLCLCGEGAKANIMDKEHDFGFQEEKKRIEEMRERRIKELEAAIKKKKTSSSSP